MFLSFNNSFHPCGYFLSFFWSEMNLTKTQENIFTLLCFLLYYDYGLMEGVFSSSIEVVNRINKCMLFLAVLKPDCTEWKLGFQRWGEISDCQGINYSLRFWATLDSSRTQRGSVLLVNLQVTYFLKVISETLVVPSNKCRCVVLAWS